MKNIDMIRGMTEEELAAFLEDRCAETPPDFCDGCKARDENRCCIYDNDKDAWRDWLERETER